jgi:hypothetical protein
MTRTLTTIRTAITHTIHNTWGLGSDFSVMRAISLVIIVVGVMAGACKPGAPNVTTGQITLRYADRSKSAVLFELENGTFKTIAVRGDRTFWSGAIPWDTAMLCIAPHSRTSEETSMALSDGFPKIIEVSSGNRLRLRVEGENFQFAAKHEGWSCRLRLRLQSGTVIESEQFEP